MLKLFSHGQGPKVKVNMRLFLSVGVVSPRGLVLAPLVSLGGLPSLLLHFIQVGSTLLRALRTAEAGRFLNQVLTGWGDEIRCCH